MATELPITNGHDANGANGAPTQTNGDSTNNYSVKAGLARMLKGGVIMDVVNAEQVHSFSPTLSPPHSINLL